MGMKRSHEVSMEALKWGFPKIRGTFFGVPIMRIMVD